MSQLQGLTQPNSRTKVTRGHSCLVCQQRKVKCDGQKPCSTCVKNRVECISKPPSLSRRRKPQEASPPLKDEVLLRIQRLEAGLLPKASGSPPARTSISTPETEDHQSTHVTKTTSPKRQNHYDKDNGVMVQEDGHSRYVENTLWAGLKNELQTTQKPSSHSTPSDLNKGSAEGLIFGRSTFDPTLDFSHPTTVQIFKLWQTFLDNVNPLVKVFHAPTMQQLILEAIGDIEKVSASIQALLFSIYLAAVVSMRDEECLNTLGDTQKRLIDRFSKSTELALSNARFLKSYDIVVLQAFTIFLLAMRQQFDSQSLWLLTGIAVRSGQRIGLHRESASREFSVFDAELRRRLWWQINILDGISAKLSGAAVHGAFRMLSDTKRPLNVNDSDLWPTMKEVPKEHSGITEMLFTSVRCEIGEFMHSPQCPNSALTGELPTSTSTKNILAEKDAAIYQLESHLDTRYLQHLDTSIATHRLSWYLSKAAIAQMRLAAHHPWQYADKGASMPQHEKDMLFKTALEILEYHNSANSTKSMQGFLWHVNAIFSFEAFIYTLGELSHRQEGEMVHRAWRQVQDAYEYHPDLIEDTSNALYFAIGNLAVRAWAVRSAAMRTGQRDFHSMTPSFIMKLHARRNGNVPPSSSLSIVTPLVTSELSLQDNQLPQMGTDWNMTGKGFDQNSYPSQFPTTMNTEQMDWEYWQALLDGREINLPLDVMQQTYPYN